MKKTLGYFLEPFGLVTLLLLLTFYFFSKQNYKRAYYSFISVMIVFFLFSYPPISNFLIQNLENQYPKFHSTQSIKYIHILGNGHIVDDTQPISSHLSDASTKRVLEGVIIHKSLLHTRLIFTGYSGKSKVSNAQMGKNLALALGVKEKEIVISSQPVDTRQEALFCKTLVEEHPFVLVTSATHMPRAMIIFESLGLHPIAAPTDYHKTPFPQYLRMPCVQSFHLSSIAMHEYLGILYAKLLNNFQ